MAHYKVVNALLSPTFLECVAGLNDRKGCIFTNDMKLTRQNMKYVVFVLSAMKYKSIVNLEITTFFFICVFHTVPTFLIWGCSKNIQYGSSHLMVQLLDCHHKGYRFTSMQGCFGMVSVGCSKLMWDQWGANSAREVVNKRSVHHTNQAIATVYCWYTQLISI